MTYLLRAAVFAVLCSCGNSTKPRSPQSTNRCPSTESTFCVTDETCSYDREQGCLVCQCEEMGRSASQLPPDSRAYPPE